MVKKKLWAGIEFFTAFFIAYENALLQSRICFKYLSHLIWLQLQKIQKQHNCIPDEHYVQTLLAVSNECLLQYCTLVFCNCVWSCWFSSNLAYLNPLTDHHLFGRVYINKNLCFLWKLFRIHIRVMIINLFNKWKQCTCYVCFV